MKAGTLSDGQPLTLYVSHVYHHITRCFYAVCLSTVHQSLITFYSQTVYDYEHEHEHEFFIRASSFLRHSSFALRHFPDFSLLTNHVSSFILRPITTTSMIMSSRIRASSFLRHSSFVLRHFPDFSLLTNHLSLFPAPSSFPLLRRWTKSPCPPVDGLAVARRLNSYFLLLPFVLPHWSLALQLSRQLVPVRLGPALPPTCHEALVACSALRNGHKA